MTSSHLKTLEKLPKVEEMITKHVTCLIILISKKFNLIAVDLDKH